MSGSCRISFSGIGGAPSASCLRGPSGRSISAVGEHHERADERRGEQELRRRNAGVAADQADDIGSEPLPDRVGDHVVADIALQRSRRRIGRAQHLLADHQHQVAEPEQRREDQKARKRRPQSKARAGDA